MSGAWESVFLITLQGVLMRSVVSAVLGHHLVDIQLYIPSSIPKRVPISR